ncbi:MAG: radical SAM protein [Bacteroidales bacterium]|nr:radical SAM protein [Bacteroidales bacterium]
MYPEQLKKIRITLKLNSQKWKEANYGPYYKTLLLFITNKCNLRCKSCFNKSNIGNSKEMSFEYVKTIVDNNPQVTKYDIMGGEPMLHTELDKILTYLDEHDKKIGLYTNGMMLSRLKTTYKNLKLNFACHSIISNNTSLKPINIITEQIKRLENIYPIKLCYLISKNNRADLALFSKYIEDNFSNIKKLTIGVLRNESDYWNNSFDDILPLEEYPVLIQNFLDMYSGRLNIDIFTEGVVFTPKLPQSQPNQINRFKCIFTDNKYTECLYDVGVDKKIDFNPELPIKFCNYKKCPRYGRNNCLTDKIKLIKI